MKNVILCLVALIVGWFLGASFGVSEVSETTVEAQGLAASSGTLERISDLEASLAEAEAALVVAQSELETVRAEARRLAADVEEAGEEVEPTQSPFMANVQSIAVESSKRRKQEELEKLELSLNLRPEQVAALEAYYAKGADFEAKMMERMFSGESMDVTEEEVEAMASEVEYHSVSDLLGDILTPEQQARYEENQAKEGLERQEATAYRELSSLQQQFLLDEEQKDRVFEIFYDKDYAVNHDEWESLGIDSTGTEAYMDSKVIENDRLLETLSEVLTGDQLELYRNKLEADFELQQKSMQMFGGGLSSKVKEK